MPQKEIKQSLSEKSELAPLAETISQMAGALENMVTWAEDHLAMCKSSGEKPAIDAYRTKLARKALDQFYKTIK
ncbi:MAG TPA: hypothetical protein ACFYEF_00125 [Candidatus Wunengus sp. YC63]|uniref:hypothetical protein n=1 Tax=Candidatus Wunengus sp. YC63 TaxID=3367699 RepID=UPI0040269921